jgi:hypothetical protein
MDGSLSLIGELQPTALWKRLFGGDLTFFSAMQRKTIKYFSGVLTFGGTVVMERIRWIKATIQLAVGTFYPRTAIETVVDADDHSVDIEVRH